MEAFKKIFFFTFIAVWFMVGANILVAQERYSTLIGTVIGIRTRIWLDVESEKDKTVVNLRIGRRTVYTPHRYPNIGERVRVEYLTQKGIPVAYTVTILEGSKETPKKVPE